MRLVCPNCEAKYEVPEDAIPETGRDVQCANCGHAWYQMRSRAPLAESTSAPVAAPASAPAASHAAAPVAEIADAPAAIAATSDDAKSDIGQFGDSTPEDLSVADAAVPAPTVERVSEVEDAAPVDEPAALMAEPEVPVVGDASDMTVGGEAPVPADAVAEAVPSLEESIEVSSDVPDVPDVPDVAEEVATVSLVGAVPALEASVVESLVATEATETEAEPEVQDRPDVAATTTAPVAYAVDESVLAILREEADREAQARRAEAAKPLETQTDLGIEAAIPAIPAKPVESVAVTAAEATRRTRLPDVEEINSTLRPSETAVEEGAVSEAAPAEGRSSFRSGFLLVLTVAILGSALYGSADALASAVPSLAGPLKAYVSFVDGLRLHLDGLMQSATVAINGG